MSRAELEAEATQLFERLQLAPGTLQGAVKNVKLRDGLVEIIKEAGVEAGCAKQQGALLYTVAGKYPTNALTHRKVLLDYITSDKIKSNAQLDAAFEFLTHTGAEALDAAALEAASGVGVVVTPEQTAAAVAQVLDSFRARLTEERYHFNTNLMLADVRAQLPWVDVPLARASLEEAVVALLGPKTEADMVKPEKKKKPKAPKAAAPEVKQAADPAAPPPPAQDPYAFLPKPSENNKVHTTVPMSDGSKLSVSNTPAELAHHLQSTGGRTVTRFPPEPNGYLHIGHAKAMFVDFGAAAAAEGGECNLRFDDTNPEAEKQEYIDHIQEIVSWLGWTPARVTYSSDCFERLHALAVQLIRQGDAYVCHQTGEEIRAAREARTPSPWRDRPAAESERLFEDMRRGLVDEGAATLRLRMDPWNDNYNMFDLVAYRIKFAPHPHAGRGWCIYPSYDFTHCIVDSIENVTHSMCTLEFESRRASYFWLLEKLGLYKPVVWEYSRLVITHTVLSKRRLLKLVADGHVSGWDDPRLLTLAGLRRRGVSPEAINAFCRDLGVTRSEGEVHVHKLEHAVRADLDAGAPRRLAVLRPLRVEIENYAEDASEEVRGVHFPGRGEEGYGLPLSRVVYVEATDWRDEDVPGYYGLAPGKSVMLRYAYPIAATGVVRDAEGRVSCVKARYDPDYKTRGAKPPKGVLNWVAQPRPGVDPPMFEARLYDLLFASERPGASATWLEELNPDSLQVIRGCFASPELAKAAVGDRFQLERLGYFCVDPDSKPGALVLNRTVTLRESTTTKQLK